MKKIDDILKKKKDNHLRILKKEFTIKKRID